MLTMNGFLSFWRRACSFITECTDRLEMIFTFCISFMANTFPELFSTTFQTLPNPPFPTTNSRPKELSEITWPLIS